MKEKRHKPLRSMALRVSQTGFEPVTFGFGGHGTTRKTLRISHLQISRLSYFGVFFKDCVQDSMHKRAVAAPVADGQLKRTGRSAASILSRALEVAPSR
jgi:hypothetical protein